MNEHAAWAANILQAPDYLLHDIDFIEFILMRKKQADWKKGYRIGV